MMMMVTIWAWLLLLWSMVSLMKMVTDFKQMEHYFYLWERESDADLASVDWGDEDEVEAFKSRYEARYVSYLAHRKAIFGF